MKLKEYYNNLCADIKVIRDAEEMYHFRSKIFLCSVNIDLEYPVFTIWKQAEFHVQKSKFELKKGELVVTQVGDISPAEYKQAKAELTAWLNQLTLG